MQLAGSLAAELQVGSDLTVGGQGCTVQAVAGHDNPSQPLWQVLYQVVERLLRGCRFPHQSGVRPLERKPIVGHKRRMVRLSHESTNTP